MRIINCNSIPTFSINVIKFCSITRTKLSFELCCLQKGVFIKLETSTRHEKCTWEPTKFYHIIIRIGIGRCHSGYGPPFADLDPPTKLSFYASFVLYLVTNSICKLFVDVLFTQHSSIKVKKTAISFQFCRVYYSESYNISKN